MASGKIYQINVKSQKEGERGMPKFPVESAIVTEQGVEGDYNNHRTEKLNKDPNQAILIMPLEMIVKLNEEGWPIKPGDIGENITSEGINYDSFEPGKIYKLGKEVTIQISKACTPCKNLYNLHYVGKDKGPAFLKALLNRRGWYAKVINPGMVRKGDTIEEIVF